MEESHMRVVFKLAQGVFALGLVVILVVNVGSADAAAQQVAEEVSVAAPRGVGTAVAQAPDLDAIFADVHYRDIGPTRQSGRFVSIAADPRDTNTFYAATASGGLDRKSVV
jgi:hypothetical protein